MQTMWKFGLLASSLAVLVSCGGGGSKDVATTFSGKVIDGYIQGAKVCLDVNSNLTCDASEPSATTDSTGAYSFQYSGSVDGMQVLAVVEAGAIDLDLGPITESYSLLTPAESAATGKGAITPLTTLVAMEVINTGKAVSEAEQSVIATHKLTATELVGYDFKAANDSKTLAVAQVTAAAIAEVHKQIKAAAGSDLSPAEAMKAAIKEVKTSILPQLILPSGDVAVATTGKQSDIMAAVKTEAIGATTIAGKIQNIVAQTKSGDGTVLDTKKGMELGIVVAETDSGYYYNQNQGLVNYEDKLTVTFAKLDTSTGMTIGKSMVLVGANNWYKEYKAIETELVYTDGSTGWIKSQGTNLIGSKLIFSGNCVILPLIEGGSEGQKICTVAKDLSGKKIGAYIANLCKNSDGPISGCDVDALFPAGSLVFDLTMTVTSNIYRLGVDDDWDGYVTSDNQPTISSFIEALKLNPQWVNGCRIGFMVKSYDVSSKKGVFKWGRNSSDNGCDGNSSVSSYSEETNFEVKTLGGKQIAEFTVPGLYRKINPGNDASRAFFAPGTNASGHTGIYSGEVKLKGESFTTPFTGDPNAGSQFMSKPLFDAVLAQKKLAPFPY